jgi:hypothetical protein
VVVGDDISVRSDDHSRPQALFEFRLCLLGRAGALASILTLTTKELMKQWIVEKRLRGFGTVN